MRAGRPVTRQGIEAGKVLLGILDAKSGDASSSKALADMTIEELEAIVRRRGNAAKTVTIEPEVSDMFD